MLACRGVSPGPARLQVPRRCHRPWAHRLAQPEHLGKPVRPILDLWVEPGRPLDNAVAESFNSTLEFELLRKQHFSTREQARRAVAGWIDEYNTTRSSTDGMLSPVAYERHQAAARPGAAA